MPSGNGSSKRKKVVLAYSGGLDTSVAINWLKNTKHLDVVTCTLDLGQDGADLKATEAKAKKIGAVSTYTVDAKDEFCDDFIKYAIWANALYGGKYPLATALGRPLIAKHLAAVAHKENADFIAHGCTGKGNDQVRIEVSTGALHAGLKTIAPMREWIYTRDEAITYAEKHGIPVPVKKGKAFSIDENLWGRSIEAGPIEDATLEPPEEAFLWTNSIADAPNEPTYVTLEFVKGLPVALNGKKMKLLDLVLQLNRIAGENGVGRIDQIEDRLVGIKSREVYESPAAVTILYAHHELETLVLNKDVLQFKTTIEQKFSELTYNGLWYSPLMEGLKAFLENTQRRVTGTVKVKLQKGNLVVAGRTSPYSLYNKSLATYGTEDSYDHTAAEGFIKIWGLPLKVWNKAANQGESAREPTLQAPRKKA